MDQSIAPLIFLEFKIAIIRMPITAIIAPGAIIEPRDTRVASLDTTIPAPVKPIKAIKSPIPAVTAYFIVSGIQLTTASRTLVTESIMKIIPSTKTAVSATCHGTPMAPHTVNAKKALSPIPDASAKGALAYSPMSIVVSPAARHVAVTSAPAVPSPIAVLRKLGFTAIM